ncbi:MAG: hypothetical protein FWE06_01875 [Oscillospiraceae bacterium]|nr:hypothetical protein [Oscillospiraceae bacterium]
MEHIDLPLGLHLGLMQRPQALQTFSTLSDERKAALARYVENHCPSRQDVDAVLEKLSNADTGFF